MEICMARFSPPPGLIGRSAGGRLILVGIVIAPLWAAIHWAVLLP